MDIDIVVTQAHIIGSVVGYVIGFFVTVGITALVLIVTQT